MEAKALAVSADISASQILMEIVMFSTTIPLFNPAWRATASTLALLSGWHRRARSRCELAQLDARLLRDIGLDRARALHEARKPFWRD
jgi:uncharacterized protein YjiS (DUF1127 family)